MSRREVGWTLLWQLATSELRRGRCVSLTGWPEPTRCDAPVNLLLNTGRVASSCRLAAMT